MINIEQLLSDAKYNHSRNVANISKLIALNAGYPDDEAKIIEQAALLHDIGKNAIPPDILNKPDKLTPEEYEIVKTHTEAGYKQIMEAVKILTISASVAKEHHERLNGEGYLGISGININPYSKLISVADVFDALMSRRPYKESWDISKVINYLSEHDEQFDRSMVKYLINVIRDVLLLYNTSNPNSSDAKQAV